MTSKITFPKNFLFGTATAGHQIEGNNCYSDWWEWEKLGKTKDPSGLACKSWQLWREDIKAVKSINNNAYRFGIEWARIEPEEGKFDLEAIKQYSKQIKELHKNGIQVMLTLWHFVMPLWFSKKGGWEKRKNRKYFLRFVEFVWKNLEEKPDFWVTMNEPSLFIDESYFKGIRPPGKKNLLLGIKVYWNLSQLHREIYELLHKRDDNVQVGIALAMGYFVSEGSWGMKVIKRIFTYFSNEVFLNRIREKLDFLGINYYQSFWITRENLAKVLQGRSDFEAPKGVLKNDLGWSIWPEGIYRLVKDLKKYRLPIYITENGISDEKDGKRKEFIRGHLEWILRAINEGIDAKGYFYWSLIDNFEWLMGFGPKFGLFKIDPKTFARIPRESAKWYAQVSKSGELG